MDATAISANPLSDDIVLVCESDADEVFEKPDFDPDAELEGALLYQVENLSILTHISQ